MLKKRNLFSLAVQVSLLYGLMVHSHSTGNCIESLKEKMINEIKPVARKNLVFNVNGNETFLTAASGLVRTETKIYVVADNDLKLGILDIEDGSRTLDAILPGVLPIDEKARKKEKPDFESMFRVSDARLPSDGLVAFPSGSTEKRFTAVYVPTRADGSVNLNGIVKFDLTPIFRPLVEKYGAINIEGSLIEGDRLVLFHRGNSEGDSNKIFEFKKSDFIDLIMGINNENKIDLLSTQIIDVGELDGVKLTVTDIALFENRRFFIAAAENTTNPIDDGEVMGTVLGEVSSGGKVKIYGTLIRQKAEGLSLRRVGQSVEVSMVTDNDDPHCPSELLEFRIELP